MGLSLGERSNMYRLLVGVDYVPVESGEGVVEDAEFSLGNKQRANLALSENEDRTEPVDNSGLLTEISKGSNWHLADGEFAKCHRWPLARGHGWHFATPYRESKY